MTLDKLKPREKAIVLNIGGKGPVRRRLIDMGITPNAIILMKKTAPFGDPIEILIRGYSLSIGKKEATQVEIKKIK